MAPRPSSASIGYRPNCVVLTLASMGMSVCRRGADFPLPTRWGGLGWGVAHSRVQVMQLPIRPGPLRGPGHLPRRAGKERGSYLAEHAQREVERDAPVRLVDDLADPQVPRQAAQDVGVLAAQPVVCPQPIDGVPN